MEIKKILVPVDGSPQSRHAVDMAAYLAGLSGAQITLLTVVDLNKQISSFEQVSTGGYVPSELKEEGYQLLTGLIHGISADIKASARVEIGSPAETVMEVCSNEAFDLVVIGSRGLNHFKQLVMGSVSQYVLHHADCPVLIAK